MTIAQLKKEIEAQRLDLARLTDENQGLMEQAINVCKERDSLRDAYEQELNELRGEQGELLKAVNMLAEQNKVMAAALQHISKDFWWKGPGHASRALRSLTD